MGKRLIVLAASLSLVLGAAAGSLFLSGVFTTQAVQNPTIELDTGLAGNTYSDPGVGGDNSMAVGNTDACLNATASNILHTHNIHVLVRNIQDMIGWQVRVNYIGDQWRPNTVNFAPFNDSSTLQNVSFVNLPIDGTVHRDLTSASQIPASAPGPQTAAFGSSYLGTQTFAVSPDTPPKVPPDDTTYNAPSGGVLALVQTQVLAGNASP